MSLPLPLVRDSLPLLLPPGLIRGKDPPSLQLPELSLGLSAQSGDTDYSAPSLVDADAAPLERTSCPPT
jgi:hypothetical protein